jgi:hypothetical protein
MYETVKIEYLFEIIVFNLVILKTFEKRSAEKNVSAFKHKGFKV